MSSDRRQERIAALVNLDIEAARRIDPAIAHLSDEGILVGMHKARLHLGVIPMELRQQSLDFLRAGGWKDMFNAPLPNEVPE